jgi:outer membrane lipoprotein-sorting protein
MRILALTLLLTLVSPAMAAKKKAAKKADPLKEVEAVLASYRKASAIKAKVKKTVTQETMGTEMKSEGEFFFSKGKLRLDFTEKTTLVYDGKFVWFESRLDDENVQVTKMKTNDLKRSRSVLTALFEKKDILRGFKLLKAEGDSERKTFTFEPKAKKDQDEVKSLEIVIAKKDLEKIAYKDNIENTVVFEFLDLTRGKVPATKFSYKPPKKAEVTVL